MNNKEIKCCLFDLDGTVYLGNKLIPGALETISRMRKKGIVVRFLTNNSSKSRNEYLHKLRALGLEVAAEEIYTSGLATINYVCKNYKNKSVYLIGTDSLRQEFIDAGILLSDDAEIVVIGFDTDLTYSKLATATSLIDKGAILIATHPDFTCPVEGGRMPDVGSFLMLIKGTTGRDADVICGKPYKEYADGIIDTLGYSGKQIAMFGDRLMTDMRFALNNGFVSCLVLSGEATRADLDASGMEVEYVFNSIAEVGDFYKS